MFTLLLFILLIVSLIVLTQREKHQSNKVYWNRINAIEEERKTKILFIALEHQRLLNDK